MNFLLLEADTGLDAIILKIASFISVNFTSDNQSVVTHFSRTTNGVINSLSSGDFSSLVDSFVPVGCMMAMIYLSKEFFEKTTLKNIDIEQIFKMFLKLVVACILISNVKSLIIGMNTFTTTLTNEITTAISGIMSNGTKTTWDRITEAVVKNPNATNAAKIVTASVGGVFDFLIALVYSPFLIIGSLIYTVAIEFASYSRAMTIGYKALYAPIAVSNIIGYSTRNAAISYLKSIFATFMQMPIALLGSTLALNTAQILITTSPKHPILAIAVYFMGIGWIAGSQRIAKELFC